MIKCKDWAVLFDVDGMMVDNHKYHEQAWIELGRRLNLPIDQKYYRQNIHARSNDEIVKKLFPNKKSEKFIQKIGDEKEAIYRELYRPFIKEIPGLTKLLKALNTKNVPCAAVSNSPKENVDMVIDVLSIRNFFDVVLNCNDVSKAKPDPAIYLLAAKRLNIPIQRCIIFEDSFTGFKATESCGAPYIVITTGMNKKDQK